MSLSFNDTTTRKGLVQIYEKECGFEYGDISGDTDKLKEFAADCNLALDDLFTIGFKASGTWQLDDSNFDNPSGYPIIKADLVSGRRDYLFLADGGGNLILDIYRVLIADSTGRYREILPVDQQTLNNSQSDTNTFIDGQNSTGIPTRYDKTANSIFLDLIPNYNYTDGLKIFINREPSYFTSDDTTKKAGISGNLHRYLALKPAMDYARRKTLASHDRIAGEVQKFEQIIIPETFDRRQKDVKRRMIANVERTD